MTLVSRFRGLLWLVIVGLMVLACGPRGGRLEGALAGDAPLAVTNRTSDPIDLLEVTSKANFQVMFLDLKKMHSPILPGQTARFSLKPGSYSIRAESNYRELLDLPSTSVTGPTQLVLLDSEPPPADLTRLEGFEVRTFARRDRLEDKARAEQENAARAHRERALAECKRWVALPAASPGRTKATGRWHCVFGGGTYTGSDYVDLVQLADGHLTATVNGVDRNSTWDGSLVGDEVHFRWTGVDASGATLRLDPSGKAMIGEGHTFTDGGECLSWKLTCTR